MTSRIDYNNPRASGAFGLPYHYEMVSDSKRVNPFMGAIRAACKGKRVIESGTGTGIMSLLAAQAGAKKVYAVEKDPTIYKFAKGNIAHSPYANTIKLILGDTLKIKLKDLDGEKADVIIAENLSTWQVTEPQIPILNYANKHLLKKNAIRIPGVIWNELQLVHTNFSFKGLVTLRTNYFEFTGIKKAANLSSVILFDRVDLSRVNGMAVKRFVVVTATHAGVVNAMRITSPLKLYRSWGFKASDSLMPPVVVPFPDDVRVKKGQKIRIDISYTHSSDWDKFRCKAAALPMK